MKKILLVSCMFLVLLAGCSSYDRDTTAGELIEINYADALDMIENKETFALIISQSGCAHCKDLKEMLSTYLEDHHVVIYDALLDDSGATLEDIQALFPEFKGTPDLYVVNKGKLTGHISGYQGEEAFDEWVQEHKLDEVKK